MKNFQRASLACSVSVIAAFCLIAPASAATQTHVSDSGSIQRLSSTVPVELNVQPAISAPAAVKLTFSRSVVTTIAAPPPPPAPVAEVVPQAEAAVAAPATPASVPVANGAEAGQYTQAAAPAARAYAATAAPAPVASAPAPVTSASGSGAAIAAAALAQIGVEQDCTALVSNSLRAVGINFHSAPAGYLSLGSVVSQAQAQPGDLIYYANGGGGQAHIAVYIGGGKAVHGGWEGHTTKIFSVNVGSGPTFIHVR